MTGPEEVGDLGHPESLTSQMCGLATPPVHWHWRSSQEKKQDTDAIPEHEMGLGNGDLAEGKKTPPGGLRHLCQERGWRHLSSGGCCVAYEFTPVTV